MITTNEKTGKDSLVFFLIVLMLMIAPVTVSLFQTTFSVGGAAKFYVNELIIVALGSYVILYQLLFKRQLNTLDARVRLIFYITIGFGCYYVLSTIVRYFTGTLSFGSFFLARIIVESVMILLMIDYYKIKVTTIVNSLIFSYALLMLWQYGILFLGEGAIRGHNPVLTGTYVYVIFCNTIHVLLAYCWSRASTKKSQALYASIFLLNLPIILLSGSRVAFITSAFILTIFFLFQPGEQLWKRRVVTVIKMYGLFLLTFILVFVLSTNENKGVVVRSISFPLEVVEKVMPASFSQYVDNLLAVDVDKSKIKDLTTDKDYKNSTDYIDDTIGVSSMHRKEANQKAYKVIFKSPTNFLFGIGTGVVHRYGDVYQKPHNYFAQYTLPFGIIGFVFSLFIFFLPLFLRIKENIRQSVFSLCLFGSILLNSFLQPDMGNIVIVYSLMLCNYLTLNEVASPAKTIANSCSSSEEVTTI